MLTHGAWNGWCFADIIAPSFLGIIGVSISLSLPKGIQEAQAPWEVFLHTLRRSAILYLLGISLNFIAIYDYPDKWEVIKCTGIFQRIGIDYLIAGILLV